MIPAIWVALLDYGRQRRINSIEDVAERIQAMEQAFEKGHYKRAKKIYYINLSVCYHQAGDSEKALQLLAKAESYEKMEREKEKMEREGEKGFKTIFHFPPKSIHLSPKSNLSEYMIELNKVAFLIALKRCEEATEILEELEHIEDEEVQNLVIYHRRKILK